MNFEKLTLWLVGIGAIDGGLNAFFNFSIVNTILPVMWAKWVYVVIGIAGIYLLYNKVKK